MLKKEDKWKAASHLQKCIRRGWAHKIPDVAKMLWDVDNAYLRYRLAVIAVEDIGIANIEPIESLLTDKINKRWVDSIGGISELIIKMQDLAFGFKDRTACVWGSIATEDDAFIQQYGPWLELPQTQAIDIALNTELPLQHRAAAVFKIVGTDLFPHGRFPERTKGHWEEWLNVMTAHGVPASVMNTMRYAQKTQMEWHSAFLGLCYLDAETQKATHMVKKVPDIGDVQWYCSAAIDGHTAEGKKAISSLWYQTPELQSAWRTLGFRHTDEVAIECLRKMIFILEGGQTNSTLLYKTSQAVETYQKEIWAQQAGIDGKEAAKSVWQCIPRLHKIRQHILNVEYTGTSTTF